MSHEPEHFLDTVGGFIGSVLAGSQGYDPHLGQWIGHKATRFARGLFSSNEATTEQILTMYAAVFRHMAESDGGLDDGRRERIVRMLTLLNANASPSLDVLALRRIAEDASRDVETIQVVQKELCKDAEVAYTVLEVCFKFAALEVTISDGMLGWLHSSASGVGLPEDRFNDLFAVFHRQQPDDARRLRAAEILEIPIGASRDEADAAFERLSAPYHPDRTKDFPPEIAELSAAKYREIGEAHDTFLVPTSWWGRDPKEIKAVPLRDHKTIACLFCGKVVQVPSPDTMWIARCPDCLVLLLHAQQEAELVIGNILAVRGSVAPASAPAPAAGPADAPATDPTSGDGSGQLTSAAARKLVGGFSCDGFYVHPNIPADKAQRAIGGYAMNVTHGQMLILCDTTVFGTATEGFVITSTGVHWRNSSESPQSLPFNEIRTSRLSETKSIFSGAIVHLDDHKIDVSIAGVKERNEIGKRLVGLVQAGIRASQTA
jgi:hypothetical protein